MSIWAMKSQIRRIAIDILIWISLISLIFGIFLPIMTFKKLIFFKTRFSIYSGLISLFKDDQIILFLIIIIFSALFPLAKIVLLIFIWYKKSFSGGKLRKYLHYHGLLSKWSMLDVFVVAILVVVIKLGIVRSVKVHLGIYFFAVSILLSSITSSLIYQFKITDKNK
ncbi:MAG: paraquat-inducible protein A [Candidatus Aminicenantes bacterium]|nr:paraquat-inducible protein A [Candidatus Aminicenantes bacterium]